MSRRHRVSIAIPVRNGEKYLAQTIDSLIGQSYGDFDLIIVDNQSTDATEEIARDYVSRDDRLRYHRHSENVGLIANYNIAFSLTEGELFKWCAADDLCEPDYLRLCIDAMDAHPEAVLVYPRTQFIDDSGSPLPFEDPGFDLRSSDPASRLRYVMYANHWVNALNGLIRRSALARTRLERPYPGGDYALLAELSLLGTFVELPEKLFRRRVHPDASSQLQSREALTHLMLGDQRRLTLPTWQRGLDHLGTVTRVPLPLASRLSLLLSLARSLYWRRRRMLDELLIAGRSLIRGR